jgi:hypothetical protein
MKEFDSQAGQTSISEVQAVSDVLDGDNPMEIGGVC